MAKEAIDKIRNAEISADEAERDAAAKADQMAKDAVRKAEENIFFCRLLI